MIVVGDCCWRLMLLIVVGVFVGCECLLWVVRLALLIVGCWSLVGECCFVSSV